MVLSGDAHRRVALRALGGLLLALVVPFVGAPNGSDAISLTQAEAALPLLTADPHQGAGDGVVDADTKKAAEPEGSNNVILLVAALGVLIGVLVVTRSRGRPES